jgi:hypothetical protein
LVLAKSLFNYFMPIILLPLAGKVSPHRGEAVGEDSARGLMDRLLNNSKECPEIHRHE